MLVNDNASDRRSRWIKQGRPRDKTRGSTKNMVHRLEVVINKSCRCDRKHILENANQDACGEDLKMPGFLSEPAQPGRDWNCPRCGESNVLVRAKPQPSKTCELTGRLETWLCTRCGAEIDFAEHLPPGAV